MPGLSIDCELMGFICRVKIAGEFAYHGHRVKCYDNNLQSLNSVYARYQSDKAQLFGDQVIESPNFTGKPARRLNDSISALPYCI